MLSLQNISWKIHSQNSKYIFPGLRRRLCYRVNLILPHRLHFPITLGPHRSMMYFCLSQSITLGAFRLSPPVQLPFRNLCPLEPSYHHLLCPQVVYLYQFPVCSPSLFCSHFKFPFPPLYIRDSIPLPVKVCWYMLKVGEVAGLLLQ